MTFDISNLRKAFTHMTVTMDEIREEMSRDKRSSTASLNRVYVPFYQLPTGASLSFRFVEDVDSSTLPWVEVDEILLTFPGIINSDRNTDNEVGVRVPSLTTWGEVDPIQRTLDWKSTDPVEMARRKALYRKRSYLWSGFLVSAPITERDVPENPIRLLKLGKQVQDCVQQGLMAAEFENAPWDTEHGRDFRLAKTQQGQYANYSSSSFSYRERPLSEKERQAIAKFGLWDLSAVAGAKPDAETQALIWTMYEASQAGEPFDNAAWGHKFRAWEARGSAVGGNGHTEPALGKQERDEKVAATMSELRSKVSAA